MPDDKRKPFRLGLFVCAGGEGGREEREEKIR